MFFGEFGNIMVGCDEVRGLRGPKGDVNLKERVNFGRLIVQ